MRAMWLILTFLALVVAMEAPAQSSLRVDVEADPSEATVGDPITLVVRTLLPQDARFDPPQLGPKLGPFSVVEGSWAEPQEQDGGLRWSWTGRLTSFRTGELELPPIRLRAEAPDGTAIEGESAALDIAIRSVLDETQAGEESDALADLKPPARIEPEYGPLLVAAAILLLLLAVSAVLWWLHRRYGEKLSVVPAPDDPFRRTPPHVWVYAELQKLLERRLAEQGRFDVFYSELARILKRYLSGRFRVDLMERTTEEVPEQLRQAGAPTETIREVTLLLARSDHVKFGGEIPSSEDCRSAIDEAYRIVDATKPREAEQDTNQRGVA